MRDTKATLTPTLSQREREHRLSNRCYVLSGGVFAPSGDHEFEIAADPHAWCGLVVSGGTIERLLTAGETPPDGATVLDFRPHLLAPGTIDVHTHGAVGHSFSEPSAHGVAAIGQYRARTGATAFLPTVTGRPEALPATLRTLAAICATPSRDGAVPAGIHVEGPFLNPQRRGAIHPATMQPPSVDTLRRLQDAAGGWIKMMTVAPELPGALEVIEEMVRQEIVPSIGHTDASYEQVLDAASAGARKSTHTFNAMRPLQQRDPGAVGGVLADDRLVAELIADGAHVHPGAMRVLLKAKGIALTALVTDGVPYSGMAEGVYEPPGHRRVTVTAVEARLDDGTIAGSVSPIDRNLRLLRDRLGVPAADLFTMAAAVPARLLGAEKKGALRSGADADFAVYDSALVCLATFVGGRQVFAPADS